jgi:hypothetical protein
MGEGRVRVGDVDYRPPLTLALSHEGRGIIMEVQPYQPERAKRKFLCAIFLVVLLRALRVPLKGVL